MRIESIERMAQKEGSYWWHISCRLVWQAVLDEFVRPRKGTKILDVGCGAGINLLMLGQFGQAIGIDSSKRAVELSKKYGKAALGDALKLPFPDESFDVLTALDLLEHLEDDRKALREWRRVLKPGGYALVSVPAYQWLFGPRDRELMHQRRYNLPSLVEAVKEAGLEPVFASYFFTLTFLPFLIQRVLSLITGRSAGYTEVPSVVNSLLIILGHIEAGWLKFLPLPFGSSVLVLARKR